MDVVTLGMAKAAAAKKYGPTKKAAYSFGGSGSNSDAVYTEVAMRLPFRLTVNTKRFRVHVSNRDYKGDSARTGTINFTGLWLGEHALSTSTASGNHYTGTFAAAPAKVADPFTVVDAGEYISPWISAAGGQMAKDKFYMLSLGFTASAGQAIARNHGAMYFTNTVGSAALAGQTAALGTYFQSLSMLDVWIEYEFEGTERVGLFIGDSLTEGRSGNKDGIDALGQETGYPQQYARRSRSCAVVNAYSGITLGAWALINSTKWTRFPGVVPDFVVVWALTNDIGANIDSLATMKANYLGVLNKIRTLYGQDIPIYGATTTARGLTGTQETNRLTMNTWLGALPGNLAGIFDFDRAVRNPAAIASLDADFDAGDTIHLGARGYARLAQEVSA